MKKIFTITAALAAIFAVTSCGGGSNNGGQSAESAQTTLSPKSTTISGDLSKYYEVVDKEHSLKDNDYFGKLITITLKRTDAELPAEYKDFDPVGYSGATVKGNYGFGIKVTNESGEQLFSARADEGGMSGVYSSDDLKDLWELAPGEEGIVRWSTSELDKATGKLMFTITSHVEANESVSYAAVAYDDEEDEDYSSSASSSNEWDEILDEYEELIDEYIDVAKKAQNGDMDAMSELSDLMNDANELAGKLNASAGEMTSTQASRLAKIAQKYSNVY